MSRPHHTAMLHWILGAVGVTALGAGGCRDVEIEGHGGGGAGSSGTASKSATNGSNSVGSTMVSSSNGFTTGNSAVSTGTGPTCLPPISSMQIPTPMSGPCSGPFIAQYICFPQTSGVTCDQAYPEACVLDAYECGFQTVGDKACGPDQAGQGCCYTVVGDCPVGRPFLVEGVARRASITATHDWLAAPLAPAVEPLDARTRAALAAYWSEEALNEHASIASFSRFLLELLALGAPLELVTRAERALAEEIDHARVGFALASAYAGAPRGPTRLDASRGLGALDARSIAGAIAREGCVAETIAAMQLADARDAATDPAVRSALATIAEEEAAHALLAWSALAWILDRADAAARAQIVADLRAIFAEGAAHVGLGPAVDAAGDPRALRAHGCLPMEERRALAHAALKNVVEPAAAALLAPRASERAEELHPG
ncbi:MAG: ferritin-like domain-containing protein [Polyangiaceae bacterium]